MVRENPWRTIKAMAWVEVVFAELAEGMSGKWEPGLITLDYRLTRTERRCALMHELIHEERRIGWPFASAATMETEERIVRAATALRLVPLEELQGFVVRLDGIEPVTARTVADEFDVTPAIAHLALLLLQQRNRGLLEAELARSTSHPASHETPPSAA